MKKIQGFTLVEVIVVVAVLAVVLTIATPDMNRLFARQSEMTEGLRLEKLYEALDVYVKQNKKTPNEATWVDDLSEYSELSKDQISKDTWGNARHYKTFSSSVSYLGGSYDVYYATIISYGLDGDSEGVFLPTNKAEFSTFNFETTTFNKNTDNFAIKYTDQAYKIELLEETLRRMEKLSLALAKYARVKQIQGIASDPDKSDSFIYFPKDGRSGDPASSEYYSGDTIDGNPNEATGLATKLGLPDYYGKNAISGNTMWYISNPGADSSNICGGSGTDQARSIAPFYPPVIMINESGNPC